MTKPEGGFVGLSSAEKRELLAAVLRKQVEAASPARPLSPGQRALWLLHQMAPASPAYNIAFTARIVSPVNVRALQRAFQGLVERHDALRTVFPDVRGEPMQRVQTATDVRFDVEDASAWSREVLHDQISHEIRRPFQLATGPLLRVRLYTGAEGSQFLAATFHHIVMDGWSLWVALSELRELYRAAALDESPNLPPVGNQHDLAARWQAEMATSAEGARHLEFWKRHLGTTVPILNLPTDRPRPPTPTYRGASEKFRIGRETTNRLKGLAREGRSTSQMGMLALFQVLLQRYTGQEELMVGYLSSGRSRPELESIVGYLANLLPLRLTVPPDSTFRGVLKRTRDTLLEAFDHQDYPFLNLVDQVSTDRDASRSPLFQVLFVYEKPQLLEEENVASFIAGTPGARMKLGELELESLPFPIQQEGQFDLTLMVVEVDGQLCFTIDYNTDLFESSTVRRMGAHLQTLAEAAAMRPDHSISTVSMLTDEEVLQLRAWNGVRADHGEGCIHQMIEAKTAEHLDGLAVVSGDSRLTYQELNARANRLARYLRQLGVGANTPVGLLIERSSLDLVVSILAILKAGGAFVPLDQAQPAERLRFMFVDSQAPVLVTHSALLDRLPPCGGRVVVLDREQGAIQVLSAENLGSTATPDDLAYVIYTSGSTGQPKGVLLEHRGLWNVAREQQRLFRPGPGSRVLQFASLSFDAAVYDFVMALCSGASLHLASREAILPGLPLLETLKTEAITILTIPPSALSNLPLDPLPALKTLLVAGEACPPELVARWACGRRFFNLYGPTEDTIWATYAECTDGDRLPPIGKPLANTQAYVLDGHLQELPIGVPGELHLAGPGLARGYLNQPELTARHFIPNPFATRSGGRLYKAGDLARRGEDGQLYHLGRADSQVKLRGFRIELGEIEAALGRHPDVNQAAVILREDVPGDRRLVAYVVPRHSPPPASALRSFLQGQLPDYMLPAAFVFVDDFPVNASGKADRLAFPVPNTERLVEKNYAPPSGELEQLIVRIWTEVLAVDPIGADDNFFDIGGNSLLMARVHARLSEMAPSALSIVDMFQFPTIRALATHLSRGAFADKADASSADRSEARTAGQARLLDQARRRSQSNADQRVDRN
jgi:amino acid adenylation domain-containing protein